MPKKRNTAVDEFTKQLQIKNKIENKKKIEKKEEWLKRFHCLIKKESEQKQRYIKKVKQCEQYKNEILQKVLN